MTLTWFTKKTTIHTVFSSLSQIDTCSSKSHNQPDGLLCIREQTKTQTMSSLCSIEASACNTHLNTQLAISTDLFAFYPWMKKRRQYTDKTQTSEQLFRESLSAWNVQAVWLVLFDVDLNVSQTAKQMSTKKKPLELVARVRRHIVCVVTYSVAVVCVHFFLCLIANAVSI